MIADIYYPIVKQSKLSRNFSAVNLRRVWRHVWRHVTQQP